ncbi:hypothetical protein AncyloWKF20_20315 [Ancylobacter sp. WKF20]|uniref:hypothetical protein n=1 Tax=Ancylobacter sp. WKF20 TaxID=3039801 RepID=UPI002434126B|nr:hypothetical protein [Ancylobacter sp. WKF20]WGD30062.1 hypothetical protein AncyloWKF20_20315 [Ancylobacter sp. WKF20]
MTRPDRPSLGCDGRSCNRLGCACAGRREHDHGSCRDHLPQLCGSTRLSAHCGRFSADALAAITGAELPPRLNGIEQPLWTAFAVKAGQLLSFALLKAGARTYIAIQGGIDARRRGRVAPPPSPAVCPARCPLRVGP